MQGDGATVDGKIVTVTQAGTYLISGSMADGQIVVDTADTSKVVLVLNGVSLACSNGPAVFVKSAPKRVEIFTAKDSVNILSDGMGYLVEDENQTEGEIYPNACIYACDDLRFDGEGVLYINGNADKGINTKDDIDIRGGTLIITSVGVGMRGNVIDRCAEGAAICAGVEVEIKQDGYLIKNVKNDRSLVAAVENNMNFIGEHHIPRDLTQGIGSTDAGNVTHEMPAAQFYKHVLCLPHHHGDDGDLLLRRGSHR